MKTKLLSVLVIAAFVAPGCKKNEDKKKPDTDKPTAGKTTEEPPKTPEPKKWTAEDTMKLVDEMTAAWNAGDLEKVAAMYGESGTVKFVDHVPPMEFKGTTAVLEGLKQWHPAFPDSKMEPQLVMVNGNNYAAISLNTGTNTGDMQGMKATGKKTSSFGAVIGRVDDQGKIAEERHVGDQSTMMHQLGVAADPMAPDAETAWDETVRVTAEATDAETANVELAKKLYEPMSKKDTAAVAALLADDASFRWVPSAEVPEGKEAIVKGLGQYFKAHESLTKTVKESWAAGDWVVNVVESKGKLGADMPGMKGTKGKEYTTTQFEFINVADGAIKTYWVFDNSLSWMVQIGAIDPSKMGGDAADAKTPAKK
jgi:ketosteroid isomerase-like protein/predicted ester cyclase